MARKRCTWGSCVQVTSAIERAGAVSHNTRTDYSGEMLWTFPISWI